MFMVKGVFVMKDKRTRKKADIPANETKEQCFIRVVKPRVLAALKRIALIGNCTSANYVWTPEQANKIVQTLLGAVTDVKARFDKVKPKAQQFDFEN
jgi:hypothetical protein